MRTTYTYTGICQDVCLGNRDSAFPAFAPLLFWAGREMSEPNEVNAWNDHDRWAALCSGTACPICKRREPLDVVAKLDASWVTMQEAAPVRGYVCLVSQSHAVELHDLPEAAASAFMRDARKVSRALVAATGAVKLNYEIHGNSLPHLHMHFFPRYRGDQFEGQPIDPRAVAQPVYAPEEFCRIRDAFLFALDAPARG